MSARHIVSENNEQPCRVIGLTGGIGAGKSVVARILRLRGWQVYDCDSRAKALMDEDEILHAEIAQRLGHECVAADGSLVRPAIANRIFADQDAREWLNSRVHALVESDVKGFVESHKSNIPLFVEAALFRSSGLWRQCDSIWIVDAPEEIRIKRVVERSGLNPAEIRARMDSQKQEFDFCGLLPESSVRVIINDGCTPLLPQIQI